MSETRKNLLVLKISSNKAEKNNSFNVGSIVLPNGLKFHQIKKSHPDVNTYCFEHFGKCENTLLTDLKADLREKLEAAKKTLGCIVNDLEFNTRMPKILSFRLEAVESAMLNVAKQGSLNGQFHLALLYLNWGHHFNRSVVDGLPWLEKAEKNGHSDAIYELGIYYLKHSQPEKAHQYFVKGDKIGCPISQHLLGQMYEEGLHVEQNPRKAFMLYKQAAQRQHSEATIDMVRLPLNGQISDDLPDRTEVLLNEAIRDGSIKAKTFLAVLYQQGFFVERNLNNAVLLFKQAAEQGDPVAQLEYARILTEGRPMYPVDANLAEAKRWHMAATQPSCLGVMPDELVNLVSDWLREGERDIANQHDTEVHISGDQEAGACLKQFNSSKAKKGI